MNLEFQQLTKIHNRKSFDCGNELLNTYLQKQASQDIKKRLSACYVLVDVTSNIVYGYYTLSTYSTEQESIPEGIRKKLPNSYNLIPTILLGRLAVDYTLQGEKQGTRILIKALKQSLEISTIIGALAVIVDPIDTAAAAFYEKYGFITLDSGKMFIAIETIKKML